MVAKICRKELHCSNCLGVSYYYPTANRAVESLKWIKTISIWLTTSERAILMEIDSRVSWQELFRQSVVWREMWVSFLRLLSNIASIVPGEVLLVAISGAPSQDARTLSVVDWWLQRLSADGNNTHSISPLQIDHITTHLNTAARSLLVSRDDTSTISVSGVVGSCCEALIASRYLVIDRKAGLG